MSQSQTSSAPPAGRALTVIMATICGCAVLAPMAFETVLPAMPAVVDFFGAAEGDVELSVGMMLFAMGLGQIFVGPLADRYGRRRLLTVGLITYVVSFAVITVVPTFNWFLVLRFIQGLATSAFVLLARTVIRDMFANEHAAKLLSFVYLALGTSSVLSPIIGSQLLAQFGWQSVFLFLAAVGAILLVIMLAKLPETAPPRSDTSSGLSRTFRAYDEILSNRIFTSNLAVNCMLSLCLISFVSASSPVYIKFLGVSPEAYAFHFAFVFAGAVIGSFVSSRVVVSLGIGTVLFAATALAAIAGLTMAGIALAGFVNPLTLTIPMFFVLFGFSLGSPQTIASALTPFTHTAGTASSIYGVIQALAISGGSFILSAAADGTHRPFVAAVAVSGTLALVLYLAMVRPHLASREKTA